MTAFGAHSCTSMAVKAVVAKLKTELSKKFTFLPKVPEFFYDFDKGLSDQFKQYLAKVPVADRNFPWICLSYSYDSAARSHVQARNGLSFKRPINSTAYRMLDLAYAELPVVFSLLTNDSKQLNALANWLQLKANWSFTVEFQDLLWPVRLPKQSYPIGWYIRPTNPNGRLYMCSKAGTTDVKEPDWKTLVGDTQLDGTAEWQCVQPDLISVKAASFAKNNTTIQNPMDNGVMYQLDFGYTLHYADYDDNGEIVGVITEAEMNLLDFREPPVLLDTIVAPD